MNALLRQRDLMEFFGISRSTFWRMSRRDDFPKPVMVMGMKRWRCEDLELWLNGRQENTPAEASPAS